MKIRYILFIMVFVWLIWLTIGVIHLQESMLFTMGHINSIYEMITDVYNHITNLLSVGIWL